MKKFNLSSVFVVAFLVLSACGSAASTPEPLVVNMTMSEFAFSPNVIEAKVGQQVTINLVNGGALQHEIMFGRDAMMMGSQPNGYQTDMFMMAGMQPTVTFGGAMDGEMMMGQAAQEHGGYMVSLPPGNQTAQITFTVTKEMLGDWEFGCFEQDGAHFTAGMVGRMTVTQ